MEQIVSKTRKYEDFSINKALEELVKWMKQTNEERVIQGSFNEFGYTDIHPTSRTLEYTGDLDSYGLIQAANEVIKFEYEVGDEFSVNLTNRDELSSYLFSMVLLKADSIISETCSNLKRRDIHDLLDIKQNFLHKNTDPTLANIEDEELFKETLELIDSIQKENVKYDKNYYSEEMRVKHG